MCSSIYICYNRQCYPSYHYLFNDTFLRSLYKYNIRHVATRWLYLKFPSILSSFVSQSFSVAVFSIQRYRVTVNPFHVRICSQATWRVTVATICGVWIVAALVAFPSILSKYLWHNLWFQKVFLVIKLWLFFKPYYSVYLLLCDSFCPPLLPIRKHHTIASYKLMRCQFRRWSRWGSNDATSVCQVEGPSSF